MKENFVKLKSLQGLCCAVALLVLTAGTAAACSGCNVSGAEEKPAAKNNGRTDRTIAIMTWNVQALFDEVEDGT